MHGACVRQISSSAFGEDVAILFGAVTDAKQRPGFQVHPPVHETLRWNATSGRVGICGTSCKKNCASRRKGIELGDLDPPVVRRSLQIHRSKSERVRNHRNRAKAHRCASDHRAKKNAKERKQDAGSDWYPKCVIYEGKEQILPDIAHHGATEVNCFDDPYEIL